MSEFRWNDWNREHCDKHNVSPLEAEYVVNHARRPYPRSIGDGKFLVRGQTAAGLYLQVIFTLDPARTLYVIHARPPDRTRETSLSQDTAMKHGKKSYYQRFMEMTDEQRDAEVAQFDKEIPGLPGKALTKSERALLRRAKRKGGRPKVGQGARRVLITVEQGLLKKADTYAKNNGMTRSELIARGLRSVIGSAA